MCDLNKPIDPVRERELRGGMLLQQLLLVVMMMQLLLMTIMLRMLLMLTLLRMLLMRLVMLDCVVLARDRE